MYGTKHMGSLRTILLFARLQKAFNPYIINCATADHDSPFNILTENTLPLAFLASFHLRVRSRSLFISFGDAIHARLGGRELV